jgi:hypothetical protein
MADDPLPLGGVFPLHPIDDQSRADLLTRALRAALPRADSAPRMLMQIIAEFVACADTGETVHLYPHRVRVDGLQDELHPVVHLASLARHQQQLAHNQDKKKDCGVLNSRHVQKQLI